MRTTRLLSIAFAATVIAASGVIQPAAADGYGERNPAAGYRGGYADGREHGRFADRREDNDRFVDRGRGHFADRERGPGGFEDRGHGGWHRGHVHRHALPPRHPVRRPPVRVYESRPYGSDAALLPLAILLGAVLLQSTAH